MDKPKYQIGDTVWTTIWRTNFLGEIASAETVELLIFRIVESTPFGLRYDVKRVDSQAPEKHRLSPDRLYDDEEAAKAALRDCIQERITQLTEVLERIK